MSDLVKESMGIGSSFAPRSDQIFTIRYVKFYAYGRVIVVSQSVIIGQSAR